MSASDLHERRCPHGHGPLERFEHLVGLQAVEEINESPRPPPAERKYRLLPKGLTVQAWTCSTCGFVELCDRIED